MPWLVKLNSDGHAAQSWELSKDPVVFGRNEEAQIQIDDDQMSRRHFEIKFVNDSHILTDLNSTNGTWHNGRRITHAYLKSEDQVRAGQTKFLYQVGTSTMIGMVEKAAGTTLKDELKKIYEQA
jgi:pSer/pThr/pTyr-binding forkhead associated (FHA) protein